MELQFNVLSYKKKFQDQHLYILVQFHSAENIIDTSKFYNNWEFKKWVSKFLCGAKCDRGVQPYLDHSFK